MLLLLIVKVKFIYYYIFSIKKSQKYPLGVTMFLNTTKVITHLERLQHNIHTLQLRHPTIMPVIKANAYGHGLLPITKTLMTEDIQHIAVGTVNEALLVREEGYTSFLLALMGVLCKEDAIISVTHQITPLVYDMEGLQTIATQSRSLSKKPVSIAIKFDTGMNRLGFCYAEYPLIIEQLKNIPEVIPVMVVSHLASSEYPEFTAFTHGQIEHFKEIHKAMESFFPNIKSSLMNSPGLLSCLDYKDDIARPGVALYGSNPFYGTNQANLGDGLLPVMEVMAPILSVRKLKKGAPVSYGCTYVAPHDMQVAIVGSGYADGYSRMLSNRGWVFIHGKRAKIIGRICMQMCMVDVTHHHSVSKGDQVYLLGGDSALAIKVEELAEWCGTSSYEVFCSLGGQNRSYCK